MILNPILWPGLANSGAQQCELGSELIESKQGGKVRFINATFSTGFVH